MTFNSDEMSNQSIGSFLGLKNDQPPCTPKSFLKKNFLDAGHVNHPLSHLNGSEIRIRQKRKKPECKQKNQLGERC